MKNKSNNVSIIVEANLCTGCGTCIICPGHHIDIKLEEKHGIYTPIISDGCNNCGICLIVCPGKNIDFIKLNEGIFKKKPDSYEIGNFVNCYTGYSFNNDIRYMASSGGLVTQLLIYALDEGIIDGALVTRMSKDNPLIPEPFIARTKKEIIEASRSKYCPVPANIMLKEIISSDDKKIAIVGLPCHIHGIRKAEAVNHALKEKIVLHIGLFCATTKTFLGTENLIERMNINKKDIDKLFYRGSGWPGYLSVILKNEQVIQKKHHEYFDQIFSCFVPNRCLTCIDETSELADISFGDAWLPEIDRKNNPGTSIIVCRNTVIDSFLHKMVDNDIIRLEQIPAKKVSVSQGGYQRKRFFSTWCSFNKILLRKSPNYRYYVTLPKPSLFSYGAVISGTIKTSLSSDRKRWRLLYIYIGLLTYVNKMLKI